MADEHATVGASPAANPVDHGPGGWSFWITAIVGAAVVAFGIRGLWVNEPRGFTSAVQWLVGGALALDLLVVPLGALVGYGAKRLVPAWSWPIVRAALFVTVVLVVFAAPLVTHQGGTPDNPTVRPRDYTTGLVAAVATTWAVAAAALLAVGIRRRRPDPSTDHRDAAPPASERDVRDDAGRIPHAP